MSNSFEKSYKGLQNMNRSFLELRVIELCDLHLSTVIQQQNSYPAADSVKTL